ncbi:MAG: hypothetical protein AB7O45_07430, partial [Alphaproteobacteria bacterium]
MPAWAAAVVALVAAAAPASAQTRSGSNVFVDLSVLDALGPAPSVPEMFQPSARRDGAEASTAKPTLRFPTSPSRRRGAQRASTGT